MLLHGQIEIVGVLDAIGGRIRDRIAVRHLAAVRAAVNHGGIFVEPGHLEVHRLIEGMHVHVPVDRIEIQARVVEQGDREVGRGICILPIEECRPGFYGMLVEGRVRLPGAFPIEGQADDVRQIIVFRVVDERLCIFGDRVSIRIAVAPIHHEGKRDVLVSIVPELKFRHVGPPADEHDAMFVQLIKLRARIVRVGGYCPERELGTVIPGRYDDLAAGIALDRDPHVQAAHDGQGYSDGGESTLAAS